MTDTIKSVITSFVAIAIWFPLTSMGQEPPRPSMMNNQNMADMMTGMKSKHQEMADLLAKALEDVKALQNEKDSAKAQSRLAEHAAMLERMRGKMAEHEEMMKKMSATTCGMMTGMTQGGMTQGQGMMPEKGNGPRD